MKKTVFLLLIFTFFTTSVDVKGLYQQDYVFSDYKIHVSRARNENDDAGYHISKLGVQSFEVDFIIDDYVLYLNNVKEVNGNHVFYGYSHENDGDTYYDPFLLVLDIEGKVVFSTTEDFGEIEAVYDIVVIDNVILVHFVRSEPVYQDIEFKDNIFITYDFNFNELGRITSTDYVRSSVSNENLYLYNLDYDDDFEGAITSDLQIISESDNLDIDTNEMFYDDMSITFINEALLNDEIIMNGAYIDYPGIYKLLYNDYEYTFTVNPAITGVENLGVYLTPVTPFVSSGNTYLNNDMYISGTEITAPGNYKLKVVGVNDYKKEIEFTITSAISGILHNQTYVDDVEIIFNGDGYLNNTFIESPYIVSGNGDYVFKIQGEGNYLETYYFNIAKEKEKSTFIDFIQKYDVVLLAVVVISGGIILKKK